MLNSFLRTQQTTHITQTVPKLQAPCPSLIYLTAHYTAHYSTHKQYQGCKPCPSPRPAPWSLARRHHACTRTNMRAHARTYAHCTLSGHPRSIIQNMSPLPFNPAPKWAEPSTKREDSGLGAQVIPHAFPSPFTPRPISTPPRANMVADETEILWALIEHILCTF